MIMKGIVFREFLDLVESQFSPETADAIISESELSTDGAYTTVGTYPHQEMVQLVSHLASHTGKTVPDLLRYFGQHMFLRLATLHPGFLENHQGVFPVLRALDNHIHVEVRKLYSHTELPTFSHEENANGHLMMRYTSTRRMADFAHGLIEGCIDYFKEPIGIERIDLPDDERGAHTQFTLTRMSAGAER
jgi:chitinase